MPFAPHVLAEGISFNCTKVIMIQPIATAPKDGTVILTDQGFALYLDQKNWGSTVQNGKWACCDPSGHIFTCADDGDYLCEPTRWSLVPDWI